MLDLFFRKYAWTANLVLLFAAAWLSAKTANTLVGAVIRPRPRAELAIPASAMPRPQPPAVLDDTRLYHLIGVEPPAPEELADVQLPRRPQNCKDPAAEPSRSELRLALIAGVVAEKGSSSLATIADLNTRETLVVGVGDRIRDAQLLELRRVKAPGDVTGNAFKVVAVICNEGTKEYLDFEGGEMVAAAGPNLGVRPLPPPPRGGPPGTGGPASAMEGVRTVGANKYEIDRSVIENTLNDMSKIATQARIVPSFRNGVANGFKLFSIQPGSLYASIGIQNGDVIQRVNGYEINSPEKALELYQKLREAGHVSIELERGGQPVRKEYNITGP
jgi:general secretion pathway protein C